MCICISTSKMASAAIPNSSTKTKVSYFLYRAVLQQLFHRFENTTKINMDMETTILKPEVSQKFGLSAAEAPLTPRCCN